MHCRVQFGTKAINNFHIPKTKKFDQDEKIKSAV